MLAYEESSAPVCDETPLPAGKATAAAAAAAPFSQTDGCLWPYSSESALGPFGNPLLARLTSMPGLGAQDLKIAASISSIVLFGLACISNAARPAVKQ